MLLGYLALIIGVIATVVCLVIASSPSLLTVTALSTVISLPASAVAGLSWIAGACCLLAYRQLSVPKTKNEKILQTWDKQDVKLSLENEKDRVKNLEAKIETLETALKSALKRKKD